MQKAKKEFENIPVESSRLDARKDTVDFRDRM